MIVSSRGREVTKVTGLPGPTGSMSWSANGARLVVQSRRGSVSEIHLVDARTGRARRLARGHSPAINPSGRQLLYALGGTDLTPPLAVLDLRTGRGRRLPVRGAGPTWSPDGRFIAFVAEVGVQVARPDGSRVRTVFPAVSYTVGAMSWMSRPR